MTYKQKLFYFSTFFIAGLSPILAFAEASDVPVIQATSTQATQTPQVLGLQTPTLPPIIAAVKSAKSKLASVTLNHELAAIYKNVKNKKTGKTVKTLTGYSLKNKDIALAILDPATNEINITIGRQNGKTMVFPDPAFDIDLKTFNGVNSKFQVSLPANGQVVALKYLISPTESGGKTAIEKSLYEAVYVPSSPAFSDPSVLEYGAKYLDGVINAVALSLEGLPSQAVPGQTITQAIKPSLIKSLVYAEHTDTAKVLSGNIEDTVNSLNILLALNEGDAYKYSVSTANARGIAQFIPSTYNSLVKRHAYANLIPDFVEGMSDHFNSIKAMYLLLDDYAGAVRVKAQAGFASGRVFEYGAASYNGGTTRVSKAVNLFGEAWNEDKSGEINAIKSEIGSLKYSIKKTSDKKSKALLNSQLAEANGKLASMESSTLRNETVNYLKKIYKVVQYFNGQQEQLAYNK